MLLYENPGVNNRNDSLPIPSCEQCLKNNNKQHVKLQQQQQWQQQQQLDQVMKHEHISLKYQCVLKDYKT